MGGYFYPPIFFWCPMENTFDKKEHANNIYVIRRKLAELKMVPGFRYWELEIEPYLVQIFTTSDMRHILDLPKYLTEYQKVDVDVYLVPKGERGIYNMRRINLRSDPLFCQYEPIMYNTFQSPNGVINMSDGKGMPIAHLCELIKYLYRLANLTIFM